MDYLYLDNFRGFTNTFIPIRDVNFLVGENSTGKTSVLSLLHLLGSPGFWFSQRFNSDEVQLGHFGDIVSVDSTDRSYFRIGVAQCPETDGENRLETPELFLLTFIEEKGLPIVGSYRYTREGKQVEIVFTKEEMKYRVLPHEFPCKSEEATLATFQTWVHGDKSAERDFDSIKLEKLPFSRLSTLAFVGTFFEQGMSMEAPPPQVSIHLPDFAYNLAWLAPVRSKPRMTYDSYKLDPTPEGDHTPYVIRDLLNRKKTAREFRRTMEEFGEKSGLFDSIYIRDFGRGVTTPFELGAVLKGHRLKLPHIGYGVSQSLPIVVELLARTKGAWYAIQQPEIHLHPRAQAALGDFLFQLAADEEKHFFIETHSDYIIDRFRLNYRSHRGKVSVSSQVLFFERTNGGNCVQSIEIMESGEYSDKQPKAFREFFIKEDLRLLGL